MARIYTQEGIEKLRSELAERKGALRHQIAQAIKEAKEQGDLSENAEYSDAKARQNENESRVLALEALLKDAVVSKKQRASGTVVLGSTLVVKIAGKEMTFVIVGSNEADPAHGKISNESPLGKGFMDKKAGDKVEVEAPAGKIKYEIVSVK
jgi:transcription elongation factor GreA